ncbi:MAG TPA: sulfite exporter TauE/SafE family protein [Burkholderiales bacterium]|nr:sulfite exporter TauE/SafE family protein [Burkholderiales bacterium]
MLEWLIIYLLMGLAVGFLAGMLGLGGGVLLVPLMVFLFTAQHFPSDRVLQLALGTSLASIVFTSISGLRAHQKRGAVRWDIVRDASPGLVIGTLLGTLVAERLPSHYLAIVFVLFVSYAATQLLRNIEPTPSRKLPKGVRMWLASGAIGLISSLAGAGGGILTIPLMIMCNVPIRNAIGTSSALLLPIAAAGAAGYIWTGLGKEHLPAFSLGYVYLPALLGIVVGTFITVPWGAIAAHRMPVPRLKKIFAVILLALATKMLFDLR